MAKPTSSKFPRPKVWTACRRSYREKDSRPRRVQKFGYKSRLQFARITKITLTWAGARQVSDRRSGTPPSANLTKDRGQKPSGHEVEEAIAASDP